VSKARPGRKIFTRPELPTGTSFRLPAGQNPDGEPEQAMIGKGA